MFLTLAPKKAGAPKKSQQRRDNEAAEAQAKALRQAEEDARANEPNPNSPFAGLAEKLAAKDDE
jgi:translation initiation factor IF-3